jgi:hypothetical protein
MSWPDFALACAAGGWLVGLISGWWARKVTRG